MSSIEVHDGVTEIGNDCFSGNKYDFVRGTALKRAFIGAAIPLGSNLFVDCDSLETVTLANIPTISDSMFRSCSKLKQLVIPDTVSTIGQKAFYNSGLTTVTIPSNVKSIGSECF